MSEVIEDLKALKEIQREEKWKQYNECLDILQRLELEVHVLSEHVGHVRVEKHFDFWPTTMRWMNRKTRRRGIGLGELLKAIEEAM